MDDMILRAVAIEAIESLMQHYREIGAECDRDGVLFARERIKELPAIEAAPLVHGHWVEVHGYATPGGDPVWQCSVCGKGTHAYGIEHRSYGASIADGQWVSCPNCGAKMEDV